MAEQVPAVGNVLTAIERRDWQRFERLLDPDVHWTTAVEEAALPGRELGMGETAPDPGLTRVVGGRRDRARGFAIAHQP